MEDELDMVTAAYAELVDKAISLGLSDARKHRRHYDVAYFAKALWLAKPVAEALTYMTGDIKRQADALFASLNEAVYLGSKHQLMIAITKLKQFAKRQDIDMPDVQWIPIPKSLKN